VEWIPVNNRDKQLAAANVEHRERHMNVFTIYTTVSFSKEYVSVVHHIRRLSSLRFN
jgi:hypothetical protein